MPRQSKGIGDDDDDDILTPICPIGMPDPLLILFIKETVPFRPGKNLCLPFASFSFQILQYSIERPKTGLVG